jgi:hypothetical protein
VFHGQAEIQLLVPSLLLLRRPPENHTVDPSYLWYHDTAHVGDIPVVVGAAHQAAGAHWSCVLHRTAHGTGRNHSHDEVVSALSLRSPTTHHLPVGTTSYHVVALSAMLAKCAKN